MSKRSIFSALNVSAYLWAHGYQRDNAGHLLVATVVLLSPSPSPTMATAGAFPEGSREFTKALGPGVGYGVVIGVGLAFALIMSECGVVVAQNLS